MPAGILSLEPLARHGVPHCFTRRQDRIETSPGNVAALLALEGFDFRFLCQAEQPHGSGVAVAGPAERNTRVPAVDALVTNDPLLTLVIRTADCGPVYFYDPEHHAVGLAHSGRKGTEQNIAGEVVRVMRETFGSRPEAMAAGLGPCIRPPHYEVDFAAEIGRQCRAAGIADFQDCGLDTGGDLARFYSYRMEKGRTGRHFAALQLPG
jgi:YfiH family protein